MTASTPEVPLGSAYPLEHRCVPRLEADTPRGGRQLPASVTASTSQTPDRGRLQVLPDGGWEATSLAARGQLRDHRSGEPVEPGSSVAPGPWDDRVLAGTPTAAVAR